MLAFYFNFTVNEHNLKCFKNRVSQALIFLNIFYIRAHDNYIIKLCYFQKKITIDKQIPVSDDPFSSTLTQNPKTLKSDGCCNIRRITFYLRRLRHELVPVSQNSRTIQFRFAATDPLREMIITGT